MKLFIFILIGTVVVSAQAGFIDFDKNAHNTKNYLLNIQLRDTQADADAAAAIYVRHESIRYMLVRMNLLAKDQGNPIFCFPEYVRRPYQTLKIEPAILEQIDIYRGQKNHMDWRYVTPEKYAVEAFLRKYGCQ